MYDDTTLLSRFDQSTDVNNLEQAKYWFLANKLSLNEEKMHHIAFTSDRRVVRLDSVGPHILTTSALSCPHKQLSGCLDIETLRIVYFSIFHSHLSYGTILWGNSVAYNRIFVLQKKALRLNSRRVDLVLMSNLARVDSSSPLCWSQAQEKREGWKPHFCKATHTHKTHRETQHIDTSQGTRISSSFSEAGPRD
nr:unnamed protein product [Callosobruchus chinensis]